MKIIKNRKNYEKIQINQKKIKKIRINQKKIVYDLWKDCF